jgi:hypothetical protein
MFYAYCAVRRTIPVTNPKLLIIPIAMVLLLIAVQNAFAQDGVPTSHKFDEFIGEVDDEDLIARLDNFAIELIKQPNAQGHIIVYRSRRDPPAFSHRYALRAKDYMVNQRRIIGSKLMTVDGGMSGCFMYELWIVPPGGSPPERRYTYEYPLKSRVRGRR